MAGKPFCDTAIAYLKAKMPIEDGAVELSHNDSPAITDLHNGLLATYVVDRGESFKFVQYRHLTECSLSLDSLHKIGVENLSAKLSERGAEIRPYGNIFAVLFGGNFEASLLLLDDLWDQHLAGYAPNGFVAAIPYRDILAFCDAQSESGIEELRALVARVKGGDHPLTDALYQRDVGKRGWRPLSN